MDENNENNPGFVQRLGNAAAGAVQGIANAFVGGNNAQQPAADPVQAPDQQDEFVKFLENVKNYNPEGENDNDEEKAKKNLQKKIVNSMFSNISSRANKKHLFEMLGDDIDYSNQSLNILASIMRILRTNEHKEFRPYDKIDPKIRKTIIALTAIKNLERSKDNKLTPKTVYKILTESCDTEDANDKLCEYLKGEPLDTSTKSKMIRKIIKEEYDALPDDKKKFYKYMAVLYHNLLNKGNNAKGRLDAIDMFAKYKYVKTFQLQDPKQALQNLLEAHVQKMDIIKSTGYKTFIIEEMIHVHDKYMNPKHPIGSIKNLKNHCMRNPSPLCNHLRTGWTDERRYEPGQREKYYDAALIALSSHSNTYPFNSMKGETAISDAMKYIRTMDAYQVKNRALQNNNDELSTPYRDYLLGENQENN